jgi:purine nucleosidase
MRPVILDTDIGTDVDDLLALVLLAKAPGLSLKAVTTVHGNTLLRAKLARIVCEKLCITDLPIIRGISDPLSGHEIFWPGHEGHGVAGLQNASVETTISAPQFLLNLSQRYSGELEILAIGPLTNIAATISSFPEFKSRIKRLYLMGGAYWKDFPEHNIEMDVIAAKIVFESGILITAIGLDVTLKVWWTEEHIERLRSLPNGLGQLLESQIRDWWRFLKTDGNHPHDALAGLAMIHPELFSFATCDVAVSVENDQAGKVRRHDTPSGSVRAAYDLNVSEADRLLLDYIAK